MTDPADRPLAEQYLEGRLHALARGVSVPIVAADQDVRRGRRRLLRMRLALAGGTTATLAVVLGVTGLAAGDPTATEEPPATQLPTSLPADPTTSPSEESADTGRGNGSDDEKAGGQAPPASEPTGAADTEASTTRLPGLPGSTGSTGAVGDSGAGSTSGSDPDGGATVGPGHGQPSPSEPTSAPTSGLPTPSSTPTATPTETLPTAPPTTPPPTPPPTEPGKVRIPQVLRGYNAVLAERLDPGREHLLPYSRKIDDKETTKRGGALFALGSTFRWDDGRALAGLTVTVASGWDQVEWECGASYSDWDCHAPAGTGLAEVAIHDGLRQVAVEHPDGQVVVLTADPTYADSSSRATAVEASDDELAAAAADERLTLPGPAPVAPPRLSPETFASAGVAALVGNGAAFTQTSIDRSPEVKGTWSVDGVSQGTVTWSARPVYSGAGWQCLKAYRSCTDLVVDADGHVVHVAAVKKRLGGGWVVEYDGPAYAVRVTSTDPKLPKKRAYAFVTDGSWQPAG